MRYRTDKLAFPLNKALSKANAPLHLSVFSLAKQDFYECNAQLMRNHESQRNYAMLRNSSLCKPMKFSRYFFWMAICILVELMGCAAQARPLAKAPDTFQLFCSSPKGYYPQVATCPAGWKREKKSPESGEATPPLLVIPVQPPITEKLP